MSVEKIVELLMKANVTVECTVCGEKIELGHTFDCILDLGSTENETKFYHKKCFREANV